jgi:hypothetical protein
MDSERKYAKHITFMEVTGIVRKNQTGASQIAMRKKAMTGPMNEVVTPTTIITLLGRTRKPHITIDIYVK